MPFFSGPARPDARILRPERRVRRAMPVNISEHERRLFAADLERTLPAVGVQELRHVRITPDGLLFKGLRLLPESFTFASWNNQIRPLTRAKLLTKSVAATRHRWFDGPALWITDTWSIGYFHWIADALSRLYLVRDLAKNSTLFLPYAYRGLEFVKASLESFAIGAIEFVGPDEIVHCRTLTIPAHAAPSGHFDEDVIRGVRAQLLARPAAPPAPEGARVYVTRARARRRRIANEPEVIEALRARDFQIVDAERLPFRDQVNLWSTASLFVSNHGAGLTNMLFMPTGARVVELRHRDDHVNNCYFTLASALNLEYGFQSCAPVGSGDIHTDDIVVDVERLRGTEEFSTDFHAKGTEVD